MNMPSHRTIVWTIIVALSAGVVAPATAENRMGMFFDSEVYETETTNIDPVSGYLFDGYVVLTHSDFTTIGGYELGFDVEPADNIFVLDVTGPNGWANPMGSLYDQYVSYQTPLPLGNYGVVLATVLFLPISDDTHEIVFRPPLWATFPDRLAIINGADPDEIVPCDLTTSQPDQVVATINGDGIYLDEFYPSFDTFTTISVDGQSECTAITSPSGSIGYDPYYDEPADSDSRAHFPHPEWGIPGVTDFDIEFQPARTSPNQVRVFTFEINTTLDDPYQPQTVQVTFETNAMADEGVGLQLTDRLAGISLPLLDTLEYNYTVAADETRTFDLAIGPIEPADHVQVGIGAYAGGLADLANLARTKDGATDGWDNGVDLPEPEPGPTDYVNVSFDHPDWPGGPRFRVDCMEAYDFQTTQKTWPLRVETDHLGPVTLSFWPSFHLDDAIGLSLHDPATGLTRSLLPDLQLGIEMTAPVQTYELIIGGSPWPTITPASRAMPAHWVMIGLPMPPPDGATLADVVLADASGTQYAYAVDADGNLVHADLDGPADRTRGYWLGSTEAFTWSPYNDIDPASVTVPLHQGWNLVGYPVWFPASLAGVTVLESGIAHAWTEAVALDLVSPTAYTYEPTAASFVRVTSLQAWHGYYIRALADNLELLFDYEALQVAPPLPIVGGEEDLPDALDWRVDLTLRSQAGPLQTVRLGVHPDASPDFDNPFDHPAPPRSPSGTEPALAVLQDTRDPAAGTRFRQDLVSPNTAPFSWLVSLEAATPGTHTLTWSPHDWPADHDLQLYRPDQNRVLVMSMRGADHLTVDLGSEPLVLEVRTPSAVGVGDTPPAADAVTAAPNPFNPTTTLSLRLARGGHARVGIYNARGRLVDRLDLGAVDAGLHTVTWQARGADGRELPSGVYFAALERDGARVGEVVKLSLVR